MTYPNITPGIFIARPNRFIAHVEVDGKIEICHVKNTGRCRELLIPGHTVWLTQSDKTRRKTRWDLVAVQRGERLINMDAQAPNAVYQEHLQSRGIAMRREVTWGGSRFDFYLPAENTFVEVKGVTLERHNVCLFPDAPTQRGIKHVNELIAAVAAGYGGVICFVIQMENVGRFMPNEETHAAFGQALRTAVAAGVRIEAWDCRVAPGSLELCKTVDIDLGSRKS